MTDNDVTSPPLPTIENFMDGVDKIFLTGFGFTTAGTSPSLSPGETFGPDGSIQFQPDTSDNEITLYFNGSGEGDYAKVTVTGVTSLDLNDFEFN